MTQGSFDYSRKINICISSRAIEMINREVVNIHMIIRLDARMYLPRGFKPLI